MTQTDARSGPQQHEPVRERQGNRSGRGTEESDEEKVLLVGYVSYDNASYDRLKLMASINHAQTRGCHRDGGGYPVLQRNQTSVANRSIFSKIT